MPKCYFDEAEMEEIGFSDIDEEHVDKYYRCPTCGWLATFRLKVAKKLGENQGH